jgi:hypothetical protein
MPIAESTDHHVAARVHHEAGEIDRTLALGFRLLAAVDGFASQFALPELGDIDLPPVVGSEADQAYLQSAAPLYLASELEAARLLPAVEMLAGLLMSGGLAADLGPAAPLLTTFWRRRKDRFSAEERQAFFARLFGANGPSLAAEGGRNTEFESLMIDLAEALYKLDEYPALGAGPGPYEETRLRTAASHLAANLVVRSDGMAAFAARDILATIEDALAILKHAAVQQSVGARTVWGAVRTITQRYLNEQVDVASYVTRAKSGMIVLAWLAEVVLHVSDHRARLVTVDHPVIPAATAWLQASLSLGERSAPPAG